MIFFFLSAPKVLKGPLQVSNKQEVTAQHCQVSCYMCSAGAATAGADATLLSSERTHVRTFKLTIVISIITLNCSECHWVGHAHSLQEKNIPLWRHKEHVYLTNTTLASDKTPEPDVWDFLVFIPLSNTEGTTRLERALMSRSFWKPLCEVTWHDSRQICLLCLESLLHFQAWGSTDIIARKLKLKSEVFDLDKQTYEGSPQRSGWKITMINWRTVAYRMASFCWSSHSFII